MAELAPEKSFRGNGKVEYPHPDGGDIQLAMAWLEKGHPKNVS